MKRRRLLLQRLHRIAAGHEDGAVPDYNGSSYRPDQYYTDVPPWANESSASHWQESQYTIALHSIAF